MKLSFETLGTNTYLVYEMGENDELDTMSLGMLTNNSILGFAPTSFMQMDTEKYIKYNVSAKVSAKQLLEGAVNKKRLIGVFMGVVDAMLSAEEYMLDPGAILLDLDYIFADVSTCETELICLPVLNMQKQNPDLNTFFKNILFTTQFDPLENCDHVAQLINYLNTNPLLRLEDFKTVLNGILQPGMAAQPAPVQPTPAPVQPAAQPVAQTPVQPVVQQVVQPAVQPTPAPVKPQPAPVAAVKPAPAPVKPQPAPAPADQPAATNEKPMSWLYLMQHYNKENAAIYKAQQEASKAKKAAPAPQAAKPVKAAPAAGFAVPGQNAGGFAIPGQPAPAAVKPQPAPAAVKPQPAPAAVKPQPVVQQQVVKSEAALVEEAKRTAQAQAAYQSQPMPANFGETTVLGGSIGETTVLGVAMASPTSPEPHLIRVKNNEKIPLNKPVFRIGKERSYVDYFVSDNTAISRGHANFVNHGDEIFVVDTNSTNHTYVNGAMIPSGVETKLSHGDKVRLANEEFEFKLY